MRTLIYFVVFSLLLASPILSNAQCKNFAKKVCKLELAPYIHDGNFNAAILTEGEDAELFKTFYAGQEYRIAVCGSESLTKVEFKVMDVDKRVLYSNVSRNFSPSWDFKVEATQQLIISVIVHSNPNSRPDNLSSGCVSIMFGLKAN
jgi:hypothetical protein